MTMRSRFIGLGFGRVRFGRQCAAIAFGIVAFGMLTFAAAAQSSYTPPPAPPQEKPGLFEAIGRWFDKGTSHFTDHLRGAKRSMDDLGDQAASNTKQIESGVAEVGKGAAEVTKGAVDVTRSAMGAVARLPSARLMRGRERCEIAPNGAPDCVEAAELLCRKHGFATGKSVDFTSAEECPARAYLGQGGECTTVTFISQAMCQ